MGLAQEREGFLSGGGVLKPGAIDIPDNIQPTIYWAIQQSGGVSQEGDLKNAGIIRVAPNGTPIRKTVNLEKILKNSTALGRDADEVAKLNAMLRPGDVLEVPLKGHRSGGFHFGFNELTVGLSTFLVHGVKQAHPYRRHTLCARDSFVVHEFKQTRSIKATARQY